MSYQEEYARSLEDPQTFWAEQARALPWYEFPPVILDQDDNGAWRWFRGGKTNSCWLALDRHVDDGRGEQAAIIYDSPVTGKQTRFSYAEMCDWVARVAGGLRSLGVEKGDRVIIYMPMVPEAAVAMLACARIGAIHSVVFGGFAPPELATRIDDARPKVILSASCGIEFANVIAYKPLVDEAIGIAGYKTAHHVVLQREQCEAALDKPIDRDWNFFDEAEPVECVPVDATDPLYILYTSGTTGKPKGVMRDNGGHAVALSYSMKAIYGVDAGDVFWAASDVGWVVGHSYIVYAPLFRGCSSVLFEGKPVRTPDAGVFWRVIQDHGVKSFFVAPTAYRAVKKEDPDCRLKADYDVSSLQYQFVAGERLDPPTYHWLKEHLGIPVIDHWWQTETGWSICANMAGVELMPTKPGSPTLPVPGYDLRILDDEGNELGPNEEGAVVAKVPLPPGSLPTVWGDHERYIEAYFSQYPGFYLTGDGGYRDEDGYVFIMGRTDDVINVAGHRLSTGELEEVVAGHPAVAECAVVGIADEDKGQVPFGLLLLKDGVNTEKAEIETELVQMVRKAVGPFANYKRSIVVTRLPKTRSGKILRQVLRRLIDGQAYEVPSTIDDPAIIAEIEGTLKNEGVL
ncbi:MAG: propionyl-CoA synthetase [Pseudomonadales bacterium]|jgi:propionyl-CoA synthetase|nr:propionyl-CoA synthetase [Pseudomonadales bacterium]MDP6470977.1 propionyl-CoA synthetase [Pseudomonadales bacterium]MDP6825838.1 propionyl-CoA synthetase [Pseudomonadales bacterium]MDP6972442.1 propionyl-CoA synthetase [Pseudomonadales bacterium]|tara:strand:+ start:23 stop:1906 length:1884 start_codon:yes stop_codon:yes gene_type:complete